MGKPQPELLNKKKLKSSSRRHKFSSSQRHGYRSHDGGSCFLRNAKTIFTSINIFFVLCGTCIVTFSMWASQGIYGEMYRAGEGYDIGAPLAAFGMIVIVTALAGEVGARKDIKCFMLMYFILAFLALFGMLVVGSMNYNGESEIDEKGHEWWDRFDEPLRVKVQAKFECCGYKDANDRPADSCEANDAEISGCQEEFRDFFEEREMPMTLLSMIVGAALLGSIFLSMYLMCRSTRKIPEVYGTRGVSGMHTRNKFPLEADEYEAFEGKQAITVGASEGKDVGANVSLEGKQETTVHASEGKDDDANDSLKGKQATTVGASAGKDDDANVSIDSAGKSKRGPQPPSQPPPQLPQNSKQKDSAGKSKKVPQPPPRPPPQLPQNSKEGKQNVGASEGKDNDANLSIVSVQSSDKQDMI